MLRRESSGYFTDDELSALVHDIEQTNIASREDIVHQDTKLLQHETSFEIYSTLKEERKNIISKVMEGEKLLQRELTKKMDSIALKRKNIYQEKFDILKQTPDEKTDMERQQWQYFANVEGSSFSCNDIIETQQKLKEIEGELKRSELRYDTARDLSQKSKKTTIKLSNKHYIVSLLNHLRNNELATKADDLQKTIKKYNKLLSEYKKARKRDRKLEDIAADKNKLPKLKQKKMHNERRKSIKLVDISEVSRPFIFSYFPEPSPKLTEDKAKHSRRIVSGRKVRFPKL